MKIVYIADDGTEFDTEDACKLYEEISELSEIYNILFFNKNGECYKITKDNFDDESVYHNAEKICVTTDAEVACLHWFADWHGYCEFEQITEPGTWIRTAPVDYFCGGVWSKIS